MHNALSLLIKRMGMPAIVESGVIPWACPVPMFGALGLSRIATLGINPSNREFVDPKGKELDGSFRRFHTLSSLGISQWSEARRKHFEHIIESCENYFLKNPYDQWFKRLDYIISGTKCSYYTPLTPACHLDLIPYATASKWTDLGHLQKARLLKETADTLGLLLAESKVLLLVLNGSTVARTFEEISDIKFAVREMPGWSLPRKSGGDVTGLSYKGIVRRVGGVSTGRDILVLGYNHNIQSSFGVTKKVQIEIQKWITKEASKILK